MVEIPKHRPNVVLMDIHLPGESGIACYCSVAGEGARLAGHHADRLQGHQNDIPGPQGGRLRICFKTGG